MRASRSVVMTVLGLVAVLGCSDRILGPPAQALDVVDSAAWRALHRGRPQGLLLTATMSTCGSDVSCGFAPTNYQCGAPKAECPTQQLPVIVTFSSFPPKTVVVSGSGALLCNTTMGSVLAFDTTGAPLGSVDLTPIDASDCGSDNITFGATGTLSSVEPIGHIEIDPMSPWTFPVPGGGTGVASAFYAVQLNEDPIPFQVSCTSTVVRAATVTCTATPVISGAAISGWAFKSSDATFSFTRDSDVTNTVWSGVIVLGGHVEVSATINGTAFALPMRSNDIAVSPRDWSQVSNEIATGPIVPSGLTDQPSSIEGQLGAGAVALPYLPPANTGIAFVGDRGPNRGVGYFSKPPFVVVDSTRISEAMAVGTGWYNLQEVSDRFVNLGHGQRPFMCGRARVPQMRPIIEAHEGTSWTTEPNSHVAQLARAVDSITRIDVEQTVGADMDVTALDSSVFARALAISNYVVDSTSANNIVMTPDSLVSVGGVQCKFHFFAPPQTP